MDKLFQRLPFYPVFIAIYPILYFLSENASETSPISGLRALVIMASLCIGFLLFGLLLTRDPRRVGAIALLMLLMFFLIFFSLYAPVYMALRETQIMGEILGRHRYLIPAAALMILLAGGVGYISLRRQKAQVLDTLTRSLNIISLVLVIIPTSLILFSAAQAAFDRSRTVAALPAIQQPLEVQSGSLPDIYYIILDMHTNSNVLNKLMDYDDAAFTNALQEQGFVIAECSKSNYRLTQYSIASSMNMDYLQNVSTSQTPSALYPLLQDSLVQRSLEQAGYSIYAFESGYSFTDLTGASTFLSRTSTPLEFLLYPGITPFESLIMQVSGGRVLYETREQLSEGLRYMLDVAYADYRDRILFTLNTLPELPEKPGPKFVFAHILAPHDPFVFNEDGSSVGHTAPFALDGNPEKYVWENYAPRYVSELKYLHRVIIEIVNEIIARSETPPVIILQGDHGLPSLTEQNAHFDILNAYYLQGVAIPEVYDTISPVNSFRLVFNRVFGTAYPFLPDVSYLVDTDKSQYLPLTDSFPCP